MTIPFLSKSFSLAEAMKLDEAKQFEIDSDSRNKNDTLILSHKDTLRHQYNRKALLLKETIRNWTLGPIYLRGFKTFKTRIKLGELPLPKNGLSNTTVPFDHPWQISIPYLAEATFDNASLPLRFLFKNQSQAGHIEKLSIFLMEGSHILSRSNELTNLPPGDSANFDVPMAGKIIKNVLNIRLQGLVRFLTEPGGDDAFEVSFSLNGLSCSSVDASDSVLELKQVHDHEFPLLDSGVNVDFIDVQALKIDLSIRNNSAMALQIKGMFTYYWETAYCKSESLDVLEKVQEHSKQEKAFSWLTDITLKTGTWQKAQVQNIDIPAGRIFGLWKPEENLSYAQMRFKPYIQEKGRRLRLTKNDSVEVKLKPSKLIFSEAVFLFKRDKIVKDTNRTVGISLPWSASVKESLRGSLVFHNVRLFMEYRFNISKDYSLSRFHSNFFISSPRLPDKKDSIPMVFTNFKEETAQSHNQSIQKYFNQLNDSLFLENRTFIPAGAVIRFHSKSADLPLDSASIRLSAELIYNIKVNFDWQLERDIRLVLNNSEWHVPSELDKWMSAGRKNIQLKTIIENDSHFEMKLFALAASHRYRAELFGLPDEAVSSAILDKPKANKFVALLGKNGIRLPARGKEQTQTISLEEEELNKLTLTDTALFRWELSIPKANRGHLKNDDIIKLRSFLTVEADMDMEILLD